MDVFDILYLVCGLCLFLYGMQLMGDSLKKSAGSGLKKILSRMTSNPVKGLLLGFAATAVVQSSSATTVMVVGFVNAGTMSLSASIPVILGANLGAAVTFFLTGLSGIGATEGAIGSVLQWLKPMSWTPILALVAIILIMTVKRGRKRDVGYILIGFAVLMVGMEMMSGAVSGLKESESFKQIITVFESPVLGLLVGTVMTAIIQSSGASVGILQSLSTTGVITYGIAFPIMLGQNIGTCITAMLSAFGAGKDGKKAAIIHLSFNTLSAVLWLAVYILLTSVFDLTALTSKTIGMFGIAITHTVVKLLSIAVFAPLSKLLMWIADKLVKDTEKTEDACESLDERLFTTPAIAVSQATAVINDMAKISADAMNMAVGMLHDGYDAKIAETIRVLEDKADRYEDGLGSYLVKLSTYDLSVKDSEQVTNMLHIIGDLERVSDHAVDFVESLEEMKEKNMTFSDAAMHELFVIGQALREILDMTVDAFIHNDVALALKVEPLEQTIDDLKDAIKHNHIHRLQDNLCTIEHGFVLSDMLTHYERVSDHCSNIAASVVEIANDTLDLHSYLGHVKEDSSSFKDDFEKYSKTYYIEKR